LDYGFSLSGVERRISFVLVGSQIPKFPTLKVMNIPSELS